MEPTNDINKRKVGRPRNESIQTNDTDNRKSKVNIMYLRNRYNTDEEFRNKCKQKRRINYLKSKLIKQTI